MKKYILLMLLAATLSTACKKLIDGPDHSTLSTDLIFETARDLDNLLYGAYGAIANGNVVSGYWKIFPELLADHVIVNLDVNDPADPYQQVFDRTLAQAQYPEVWRLAYIAIQNSNTVIYAIENNLITQQSDPEYTGSNRDKMLGEAYFIRALCYFDLVRFYGKQYQYTTLPAGTDPGVPSPLNSLPNSGVILRTQPVLNVTNKDEVIGQGRSTVEETYQLIISDLKKAEILLPPTSLHGVVARRGRATSFAAGAILARVYFQQNNFPGALIQINKVIGSTPGQVSNGFGLVRTSVPPAVQTADNARLNVLAAFTSANVNATSEKVSENIFDLVSTTNFLSNTVIKAKYFYNGAAIIPQLAISDAFMTAANFHANDARKLNLITTVTTGSVTKNYTKKFDQVAMNVPIIRSPELLLDRAEINAMIASTQANGSQAHLDALEDLKVVRSRAIANATAAYPTITTVPSTAILAEVRLERVRELAFEGDRLHNLRRLGALTGMSDVRGLAWNSNLLLFKIPDAETRTSDNIIQNPD